MGSFEEKVNRNEGHVLCIGDFNDIAVEIEKAGGGERRKER